MNDQRDSRPRISLQELADSAEEAGTMITDRDCLSKGKKGKYRDSHPRECGPNGSGLGRD